MDSFITFNKSVKTRDSNNTPQVDHNFTPLVTLRNDRKEL